MRDVSKGGGGGGLHKNVHMMFLVDKINISLSHFHRASMDISMHAWTVWRNSGIESTSQQTIDYKQVSASFIFSGSSVNSDLLRAMLTLGKLGNIVAETLCFLSVFPCLPTSKNFPLRKQCFLVCPHIFKCFQDEKIFPVRHVKIMLKDNSTNINNTLIFVRANVSQKMFPSLPTLG